MAPPPTFVLLLILPCLGSQDDLGWNGVGYHNPEVNTPTIDRLASSGLKIDGFYTYKVCAPARASFLTGRFPFHLAATKTNFAYFWTLEGTNLTYTMFPEKLQKAGYKTHMVGKCAYGLATCSEHGAWC
jgi:arylsulfatase A-like enzyme